MKIKLDKDIEVIFKDNDDQEIWLQPVGFDDLPDDCRSRREQMILTYMGDGVYMEGVTFNKSANRYERGYKRSIIWGRNKQDLAREFKDSHITSLYQAKQLLSSRIKRHNLV